MVKAGRTKNRFEESKSAIVAAAIAVLNRKGASRMTLAAVAVRVGLSAPTIQYYFSKKEDLAAACHMQGLERLGEFLSIAESATTGRARLELFLSQYFDFRARAARSEVEEFPTFSDVRGLDNESVKTAYVGIFRRIRRLIAEGEWSMKDKAAVTAAAHLIFSELNWTPISFRKLYPEDFSRFGSRLSEILIHGIAAPGADWTPARISVPLPQTETTEGASFDIFLQAASSQINEQGYRGASVEKIAARINLTKGAFYHHVKTKDEIVIACFNRTFDVIRRTIIAAEAECSTGLQTLATIASALVEHQIGGSAALLRVSAVESLSESDQWIIMSGIEAVLTRIASVISDGIADGSIRQVDANLGAHLLMAMINGSDELPYFVKSISSIEAVNFYVRPIFKGVLHAVNES
jgi:AcrR family transcriptional regulator